jgi:hypothetical protein
VSVRSVGLSENASSARTTRKLNRQINHWAYMNKLGKVRVGAAHTSYTKGTAGLFRCSSSARVAG